MPFQIKRIYESPNEQDGVRVLVDRLWPRGVSKEKAKLSYWLKDVAPSTALRKWFGHEPDRFDAFKEKYIQEITSTTTGQNAINNLLALGKNNMVTLLYAAKNEKMNEAIVLLHYLESK